MEQDTGVDYIIVSPGPLPSEQMSTGHLHFMGSAPDPHKKHRYPYGIPALWSRIRESKATKHIDIQSLFLFVAEIVAE